MTREEREAELYSMVKSVGGLNKLIEIYQTKCTPPTPPPSRFTHQFLIEEILATEYPPETSDEDSLFHHWIHKLQNLFAK